MSTPRVTIYDTTLRDGTQGTGISFSVLDKIRVAEKLDDFGVALHRGRLAGLESEGRGVFRGSGEAHLEAREDHRLWHDAPRQDEGGGRPAGADAPRCADAGGHDRRQDLAAARRREVFQVSLEENLAMIADTVALFEKARARGALRCGAFLRQLQGRSRTTRWRRSRRRATRARTSSCSARRTAARCRSSSSEVTREVIAASRAAGRHPHAQRRRPRRGQCARRRARRRGAGAGNDQRLRRARGELQPHHRHRRILQLKMGIDRRCSISRSCASSRTSSMNSPMCRTTSARRTSARRPSRTRAACTCTPCRSSRAAYEHIDPALVGNERDHHDLGHVRADRT